MPHTQMNGARIAALFYLVFLRSAAIIQAQGISAVPFSGPGTASCRCPDGREFKKDDKIAFIGAPSGTLRIGTAKRMWDCHQLQFTYKIYNGSRYWTAYRDSGNPCTHLAKLAPRASIKRALNVHDLSKLLNDGQQYEIPADTEEEDLAPRASPKTGDVLENKTAEQRRLSSNTGLGGFKPGDYVVVGRKTTVDGRSIHPGTVGIVIGAGGKNGNRLKVLFLAETAGTKFRSFIMHMITLHLADHPDYVKQEWALINPDFLLGISLPEDYWTVLE